jgi:hypothetical protein
LYVTVIDCTMKIPPNQPFPSFGKCIYCPSTEDLTDEHTIPLCLGGNLWIIDGSCKQCQKATHAIEGHVCGRMFKALRVHHKVPTRRPKDRPTHLKVFDGDSPQYSNARQVAIEHAPGVVAFPVFSPPTMLSGEPHNMVSIMSYATTADAKERTVRLKKVEGFSGALAFIDFIPSRFGRVLAKIAHATALAVFGNLVESELVPMILDRNGNPFTHVGCGLPVILPPPRPTTLHQIGTEPPRVCRRLRLLREWSHDKRIKSEEVLPRGA